MKATYIEYYFSKGFRWTFGIVLGALALSALVMGHFNAWIVATPLFIAGISTIRYVTIIDREARIVVDRTEILRFAVKSDYIRFAHIYRIRLDKQKQGYMANSRSRSRQVDFNEYTATIETDKKEVELLRSNNYQEFIEKLNIFATEIDVPIERTF